MAFLDLESYEFDEHTKVKLLTEIRTQATKKLREQARPAQIKIFQRYGAKQQTLQEITCSPVTYLQGMPVSEVRRLLQASGCCKNAHSIPKDELLAHGMLLPMAVCDFAATNNSIEAPRCVCGSVLEWVSGDERVIRCCEKIAPGIAQDAEQMQRLRERLTGSQESICFCDLCGSSLPLASHVWTCENGDSTILHATSYDVCAECFLNFACLA
jgi:hypothetical protein